MSSALSLPATVRPASSGPGRQLYGSPPRRGPVLPPRRPQAVPCHGLLALRPSTRRCAAFGQDHHYGGALVDEGMAVLRRRIREARMAETNYEAPPGWADWEKRYYPAYVSDVSVLAGALQLLAMGTRPGVAAAVVAMLLAGVPVSAFAVLHFLDLAVGEGNMAVVAAMSKFDLDAGAKTRLAMGHAYWVDKASSVSSAAGRGGGVTAYSREWYLKLSHCNIAHSCTARSACESRNPWRLE
ncbi:unnamed protein product [Triticum turgidum subsp. durum]|uniref:Uncharacterized protein n=1 Tax=Triticum turgidum subsp. durum TaxID=4567 RepID=A0A9R0R844_TRITD|nr:unnamed protein product [Triticum turgidum subsp. durum]